MFDEIKATLHLFRTDFDVYFHENSLHESGAVDDGGAAAQGLRAPDARRTAPGGCGSTAYGDDKDRVVIKSDGEPAYIAGDLAYFLDKRARGFDLCIYMLGADHHGYISRLKAAAAALGDDPDVVEVLIGQMVNLVRDGVPLRMSKRAGTVITLDDLIDALGVDAARYALIRYSVDTTLDLDLDLWTRQTNDNPVFYVQYAHARLASLARNAADLGIELGDGLRPGPAGHRAGVRADRAAGRLSRACWRPPPSCANRTGSPATWRIWRPATTSSTTRSGCCRWATRRGDRRHRRPAVAVRGHPAGAGERAGRAGRHGPGADVRAAPGRAAAPASCTPTARPAARRPTSTCLHPARLAAQRRPERRRRAEPGRRGRPGSGADLRHAADGHRRGRLP